ncbi:TetR/AcrR family transcriptional regulator [Subtercola lobariae]|uniref:HTH tetR-type domain-containing protein n=1 Tax=Subtercola lobariae TaxID=1588641 RepID=A0A917EUZ1_9MICO|nr:hypothetical protein [Subtercola lobariae]GGF15687.1 hypothetical protein GCM10011399_06900 [Subtercola lobariae]
MEQSQAVIDESTDHRVRVARQRRERMHRRLLEAVLVCFAETPFGGSPTVEVVIAKADVSKATYYKYFASIDEAVQQLGQTMADDMVEIAKSMFTPTNTAPFRMTAAMQIFLIRSVREPVWAAFVSRADVMGPTSEVRHGIDMHIRAARESGFLTFTSQQSALALALGTLSEGMRHLAQTPTEDVLPFVHDTMALMLRGLGADSVKAEELLAETSTFIRESAGDELPTWSDSLRELGADE